MGVPKSEVGYTIATTSREATKVHKSIWWHWGTKRTLNKSASKIHCAIGPLGIFSRCSVVCWLIYSTQEFIAENTVIVIDLLT